MPDYQRLLRAAADRCRGRLVFSYPPRNPVARGFFALQNGALSMLGREYRSFAHPPKAMIATVEAAGMRQVTGHRGVVWQVAGMAR